MIRTLAILGLLLSATLSFADLPQEPTDATLLFEGYAKGQVLAQRPGDREVKTFNGTILLVTKNLIVLRRSDVSEVMPLEVIDMRRYKLRIATATLEGKPIEWKWNDMKKEVEGYTQEPLKPILPKATIPASSESKYLYFSLQRLQERIDAALASNDTQLVKFLKERAEVLRERAGTIGANPTVLELYDGLPAYLDERARLAKVRADFLDAQMDKITRNRIRDQEAQYRAEMRKSDAMGQYYRGALPTVTVRSGAWWRAGVTAHYDLGGAMAGVMNIVKANQQYEMERLRIKYASDLLEKEKAKVLKDMSESIDLCRMNQLKHIAEAGTKAFGLPKVREAIEAHESAAKFQQTSDFRSLADLLEMRNRDERKADDCSNPYTLLDAYHTTAQIRESDSLKKSEKMFELSVKASEAVQYIPQHSTYDQDRADVLRSAASMACMAAMLEEPSGVWLYTYSPRAAYATRLLDQVKSITIDKDGQVREQQAVAHALAGRFQTALNLAEDIKGQRATSSAFLVLLARLYAMNQKHKEGIDVLEDAIKLGYRDIAFLKKNQDFNAMRLSGAKFKAFSEPQVTIQHHWPQNTQLVRGTRAEGAVSKHRYEVKNNSPFALTDVRVTVSVEIRNETKPKVFNGTIAVLEPGEKFEITETTQQLNVGQ
ncbi:MAG: hypothetical protein ACRCZF_08390, partial [Gemmataceae bacterium]